MKQNDNIDNIIQSIKNELKLINPLLIILFGSYAYAKPHENSDLDIFVVLYNATIPASFKEKQALKSV